MENQLWVYAIKTVPISVIDMNRDYRYTSSLPSNVFYESYPGGFYGDIFNSSVNELYNLGNGVLKLATMYYYGVYVMRFILNIFHCYG